MGNDTVPLSLSDRGDVIAADALLHESKNDARVEVVTRSNCRDSFYLIHLIFLGNSWREKTYLTLCCGTKHLLAVESHFLLVCLFGVGKFEHVLKVLGRATHNAGILKVFQNGGVELDSF